MYTPADELTQIISGLVLPIGLVSIMFSLGLSVSILDIQRLVQHPKAMLVGAVAQILVLPAIAFALAKLLALPDILALSLIVISACPGGVTSNALTFIGRADVPLSILTTTTSSLITVFSAPFVISIALRQFPVVFAGDVPNLIGLTGYLFLYTTAPLIFGMLARVLWPDVSVRLIRVLRPAALGILLTIVAFSVLVNWAIVFENILSIAPAAVILNVAGMATGLFVGTRFGLRKMQTATLAIEVGVQNVTMATFVGMSVIGHPALAAVPTIYGIFMVTNALVFLRAWRRKAV